MESDGDWRGHRGVGLRRIRTVWSARTLLMTVNSLTPSNIGCAPFLITKVRPCQRLEWDFSGRQTMFWPYAPSLTPHKQTLVYCWQRNSKRQTLSHGCSGAKKVFCENARQYCHTPVDLTLMLKRFPLKCFNCPFMHGAFCVQVVTYDSITAKRSGIMLNASKIAYRIVLSRRLRN